MSLESSLQTILSAVVTRTYPDVAPAKTTPPYAVYQAIGGLPTRYIDNTALDKRNTLMQVAVWAATRVEANTLIRQIEDALCASGTLTASPLGDSVSTFDAETGLRGAVQRFSIWSAR